MTMQFLVEKVVQLHESERVTCATSSVGGDMGTKVLLLPFKNEGSRAVKVCVEPYCEPPRESPRSEARRK